MDFFEHVSHVDHFARQRRGGHHRRAHQQRAAGRAALAALEVAVRRRGADLAALELVGVHGQAHRAAGAAPLEAGLREDLVQPLRFGGAADRLRARDDERLDVRRDAAAADEPRRLLEIRQASVRARADEGDVDPRALDPRCPRSNPMNASASSSAFAAIGSLMPTDCPGLMPQVTVGSIERGVEGDAVVVLGRPDRRRSAATSSTARSNAAPDGTNRRPFRYANVVSSGLT